ncbi:MAG: triose-phosphate isomerase [Candidatus Omnitrophica bacterium 4484_70.1]|nr:MAG: triose-phosphate isomerase [Candidatus Omnitrophica bacterium 4484_70.1]
MRKVLIAGNWKMHKTIKEAEELVSQIKVELENFDKAEIVVCPPFTALAKVSEIIKGTNIKLGAQNCFWQERGAFTGEISFSQLLDCGCRFVIIGHSERRRYFKEDDAMINKKLKSVIGTGLIPILCVGETLEEREADQTMEVVGRQLEEDLKGLEEEEISSLVIAYEPVWAIGTGKVARAFEAEEVQRFIRDWIRNKFSSSLAENLRILYGGSVKPENIKDLIKEEDIDGALVGGASLKADSFIEIVKNASKIGDV